MDRNEEDLFSSLGGDNTIPSPLNQILDLHVHMFIKYARAFGNVDVP